MPGESASAAAPAGERLTEALAVALAVVVALLLLLAVALAAALRVGAAVAQGEMELLAALQGVHAAAPAALHVPCAQGWHTSAEVAPVVPE